MATITRSARRQSQTRDRILRETVRLLSELGFEGTTVDRIVVRADVAKGTFFNHFERKEALLDALAAPAVAAMLEHGNEMLRLAAPVRDKLQELLGEAAGAWALLELPRPVLALVIPRALRPGDGSESAGPWSGQLEALAAQGQRTGEFHRNFAPADAAALMNAALWIALERWMTGDEPVERLQRELSQLLELVLDGLAT